MTNISRTKYTSQAINNMSFDDGLKVQVTELIGADGVLKNPATEETLQAVLSASGGSTYKLSDVDDTGYYGFLSNDGSWYIMQEISGAYRYFAGASNYSTGWTNRASHAYDYYSVIF